MPGACFHTPTWAGRSRYLYEVSLAGHVLGTAQRAVMCKQTADMQVKQRWYHGSEAFRPLRAESFF